MELQPRWLSTADQPDFQNEVASAAANSLIKMTNIIALLQVSALVESWSTAEAKFRLQTPKFRIEQT